jgi:LmbE family N-acetylglucosaminyl deacetylase
MDEIKRALIICAHSDDQVIGAGGTIAKLAREGVDVRTFICSFGEQSHPHLKPVEVRKTRVAESQRANQILGGGTVLFLAMREGKFWEDYEERRWGEKLERHLTDFKPDYIFTHAADDPHPDHRAVYRIALDVYSRAGLRCEVYSFDVWTPSRWVRKSRSTSPRASIRSRRRSTRIVRQPKAKSIRSRST